MSKKSKKIFRLTHREFYELNKHFGFSTGLPAPGRSPVNANSTETFARLLTDEQIAWVKWFREQPKK